MNKVKQYLNRHFMSVLIISITAVLMACSNGMEVVHNDFGKSVRHMEQGQVYNTAAAENPSKNTPEGIDGNKSIADLEQLERPVTAEKQMLNLIKARRYEVGDK